MRALAELGCDLGWSVSGSDAAANPRVFQRLAGLGIPVSEGHAAGNIQPGIELVVHSPAVPESNPERTAARLQSRPDISYPQALGSITRKWPTIAISGTHGKSTTTGLIGTVLTETGGAAAVLCGAEVLDRRRHGWAAGGRWAVIEACEYRRHFLELQPEIAVVLGIEPDHFDCFPELSDAIGAYRQFLERTKVAGLALVNVDTGGAREALAKADLKTRCETMSTGATPADWTAEDIRQSDSLELAIRFRGAPENRVSVPLVGRHHAANVLAAYAASRAAGAGQDELRDSLTRFSGLGRRLEAFRPWRGVRRFDDYAHHPTAVSAVLSALREWRQRIGADDGSRIVCVFQPHQVSRTERLAGEFGSALSLSDETWVVPVYAAREAGGTRPAELAKEVVRQCSSPCLAQFVPSLDHALTRLETALRPGDIFVTLGAGDIDCLQYELPRRFP